MELKNLCVVSRIALSELQDIYKKVTFASGGRRRKRFCLSQLFNNVETGKLQTMIAIPGGKTPVLSSSMMNNGVMGYYDIPAVYENKG